MAFLFQHLFRFLRDCWSCCKTLPLRHPLALLRSYFFKNSIPPPSQNLTDHLRSLKAVADARQPMPDNYPPVLSVDDGPLLVSSVTRYSSHYFTDKVVIKREPHPDELGRDRYGNPAVFPYISDRIRIEAANLQFIAANTTIPVPKLLRVWQENGMWHIKTSLVHGALELRSIGKDEQAAAVARVEEQLESEVLPQLRRLRRNFMGCADPSLPVIPPHRLWEAKDKRVWSSMPGAEDDEPYVFCHTDLGRQNILVDPKTFRIVSIIDWETAGFFPASWELPLWKVNDHLERYQMTSKAKSTELLMIDTKEREE